MDPPRKLFKHNDGTATRAKWFDFEAFNQAAAQLVSNCQVLHATLSSLAAARSGVSNEHPCPTHSEPVTDDAADHASETHPDLTVATDVTVAGTVVTQATDDCLITEPSFTPERVGAPSAHAYLGADATVSAAAAAVAIAVADASPHSPSNNGNSLSVNHSQTGAAAVGPIVQSGSGSHSQLSIREIPNFNARELRERLDFRDISLDGV